MFDIIESQFNDFDRMFDNLFSPRKLSGLFPELPLFNEIKVPMNIYETKAGNKIIELAVCGKSKEDIEVSWEPMNNGCACLYIKANDTKKASAGVEDTYEVRKLKKSIQDIQLVIDSGFNMDKLYSKIENGLLTIVIPPKEQVKHEKKIVEIH